MEPIILGLLSLGTAVIVLRPLVRSAWNGYDWDGLRAARPDAADPAEAASDTEPGLRAEVDRYREALRAGTLCDRCGQANAAGSRFCAECGRPLAGSRQPA
ncbi:MAG: zinc ribbon domain-containing protein [Gemmatimonadota bacterium]|jgi:hypothetical protein